MNREGKFFSLVEHSLTLAISFILSAFGTTLYYSFRLGWVYVDVALFSGFCMLLFWLMVINNLAILSLLVMKLYNIKLKGNVLASQKWYSIVSLICEIFTILTVIICIAFMAVMSFESIPAGFRFFYQTLPALLLFFGGAVLLLLYPLVKCGKVKLIIVSAMLFVMVLGIVSCIYPLYPFKITAPPMVIDNGKEQGEYSVVFATNDYATGYIEYEYNGEQYKVYDQKGGRLVGDSYIHTISVPHEHLENNKYRVGSVRVIDELSYGGRQGVEKISEWYTLKVNKSEEQEYLVLSDWHTYNNQALKTAKYAGDYDAVIMLGDSTPGINFQEEVVKYIVEFGGELTNGSKPIIYTRGNHETRGKYASYLLDDLGFDEFYFTVDMGPYSFAVLDSGEDKKDNHPEYGGMVNYEQYRKDMVKWFESATLTNTKSLMLVHDWKICIEDDLSNRAFNRANELGISGILSGHTHDYGLIEQNKLNGFVYQDGGHKNGYVLSKLRLTPNKIYINAWNNKGTQVFNQNFEW